MGIENTLSDVNPALHYGISGQAVLPFAIWLNSEVIQFLPHVVLAV